MSRIVLPIVVGAALGAVSGHFGRCHGGTCPLTSTWWRGAIYGGVIGLLFALSAAGAPGMEPCPTCLPADSSAGK